MLEAVVPRSKRRVQGTLYTGVQYPEDSGVLPAVPAIDQTRDGDVIVRDATNAVRYLRVEPIHADAGFAVAADYAYGSADGQLDLLEEPLRSRAAALRKYPDVPAQVVPIGAESAVSRAQWIGLGLPYSRPAPLSEEQTQQLLRASYWHQRDIDNPMRKAEAARVLGYYAAGGYTTVHRRPYHRRRR